MQMLGRILVCAIVCIFTAPELYGTPPPPPPPTANKPSPPSPSLPVETATESREEQPSPPKVVGNEPAELPSKPLSPPASIYPVSLAARPILLPPRMFEIAAEAILNADPMFTNAGFHARVGITNRAQVALQYNLGIIDGDGGKVGKTIIPDVRVRLYKQLTGQIAVPILLDPASVGLTLGIPFKFHLIDRLAVVVGQDLVSFRVHRFVPILGDPRGNASLADAHAINTKLSRGQIRVLAQVILQLRRHIALAGEGGVVADDFTSSDPVVPLRLTALWGLARGYVDIGGRIGFADLGEAEQTFQFAAFLTVRR